MGETAKKPHYAVVFEYTEAAGGYNGVRTWTRFSSQEHFQDWLEKNPNVLKRQKVIAQGVSDELAIEIVRGTKMECRISAAYQEATGPDGKVNLDALQHTLRNLIAMCEIESAAIERQIDHIILHSNRDDDCRK